MLVPIGTHLYFFLGTTWLFPLGHFHVSPNWDPPLFSHGIHLGTPTCPMLVPIGTHISFRIGYTWALPLGHSHVGPNWDPYLFSYGIYLGIPNWAFPCWSQLGPTSFFIWDTPGHSNLGIPMLVPVWTHIFFHMGYTWVHLLWHSHGRPTWDPHLFSCEIHLGTHTWAFPCWSQIRPIFIFTFHRFYLAPRMFPSGHSCCHSKWFSANRNEKIRGIYML